MSAEMSDKDKDSQKDEGETLEPEPNVEPPEGDLLQEGVGSGREKQTGRPTQKKGQQKD